MTCRVASQLRVRGFTAGQTGRAENGDNMSVDYGPGTLVELVNPDGEVVASEAVPALNGDRR